MCVFKYFTKKYWVSCTILLLTCLYPIMGFTSEPELLFGTIPENDNVGSYVLYAFRSTIFVTLAIICYRYIHQGNILAIIQSIWLISTAILSITAINPHGYIGFPDFSYFSVFTFLICSINIYSSSEYLRRIILGHEKIQLFDNIILVCSLLGVIMIAMIAQKYPIIASDILLSIWGIIVVASAILGTYLFFAKQKQIDLYLLGWIPAQIGLILALGVGKNGGAMASITSMASWGCVIAAHCYLVFLTFWRYNSNENTDVVSQSNFSGDPVSLIVDQAVFRITQDQQKIVLNEFCANLLKISGRKSEFSIDAFKGLVLSEYHHIIDQILEDTLEEPTQIEFYAHNQKGFVQPLLFKSNDNSYSETLYLFQKIPACNTIPELNIPNVTEGGTIYYGNDRRDRNAIMDFMSQIFEISHTDASQTHNILLLEVKYYDDWQTVLGISEAYKFVKKITNMIEQALQKYDDVVVKNFNGHHIGIYYSIHDDVDNQEINNIQKTIEQIFEVPIIVNSNHIFVTFYSGSAKSLGKEELTEQKLTDMIDTAKHMISMNKDTDIIDVKKLEFPENSDIIQLSSDLRYAPERGQINAYYGPIIDLENANIIGFNITPIWRHPNHGIISGDLLNYITRRCLMENTLDRLVLAKSIEGMIKLYKAHKMPIMSFRITKKRLLAAKLDEEIQSLCDVLKISPSLFRLEFTPDCIDNNLRWLATVLYDLKSIGVTTALDGFSGNGQLAYLSNLVFDRVIVSNEFSTEIIQNERKFFTLKSLTTMLKNMGIKADIKDVDDRNVFKALKKAGISNVSGKSVGIHLPAERAVEILNKSSVNS